MRPSRLAIAAVATASRPSAYSAAAFATRQSCPTQPLILAAEQLASTNRPLRSAAISSLRMASSSSQGRSYSSAAPNVQSADKQRMEAILKDFEEKGRDGSGYCVIDVRSPMEVYQTGKLSPSIPTLPVEYILYDKILESDEDDFEDTAKFKKPTPDETLVFTCARGIRSMSACLAASEAGFSKLVNYRGGSYEWFEEQS